MWAPRLEVHPIKKGSSFGNLAHPRINCPKPPSRDSFVAIIYFKHTCEALFEFSGLDASIRMNPTTIADASFWV